MTSPTGRLAGTATVIAGIVVLVACSGPPRAVAPDQIHGPSSSTASAAASPPSAADRLDVAAVAVGDISCQDDAPRTTDECRQQDTADLTASLSPQVVLTLGDLQYDNGALDQFRTAWSHSWGRFDRIDLPAPGNHEWRTPGAAGYRTYFDTGYYYARDVGRWTVYALDSDCGHVDCAQEATWLTQRLAADPSRCSLLTMHHPRVSSGPHGDNDMVAPLWRAAVEGGVDLALMGHDHDYERFARLGVDGSPVTDRAAAGTRELVIGTGGRSLYTLGQRKPGSEFSQDRQFGILDLTLAGGGYSWRYVAVGGRVLDSGSDTCRT